MLLEMMDNKPRASIILSTYNSPLWLEKVLWGYESQSFKDFEIIIADDGSDESTEKFIKDFQKKSKLHIHHVWHEDQGFRKTIILNKAILKSNSEYLIFSDGDCIPRNDFVEEHVNRRKKNHFLSGGYFMLPMNISKKINQEDIKNQRCFDLKWLRKNGLNFSLKNFKHSRNKLLLWLLNTFTSTKATWNGHSASGWKQDILAVNGFDSRMEYGGEDRELGERMMNQGIIPIRIRYYAICVHLDHKRGYIREEAVKKNRAIRKETKEQKKTWTEFGLNLVS